MFSSIFSAFVCTKNYLKNFKTRKCSSIFGNVNICAKSGKTFSNPIHNDGLDFRRKVKFTSEIEKSPDSTKKHNKKQATILDCYVYYPKQFEALRKICCDGDENFIKSMVRSFTWNATGGKSRSTFAKSGDNRYALKFVKEKEFSMFVNNGTKYFEHMARVMELMLLFYWIWEFFEWHYKQDPFNLWFFICHKVCKEIYLFQNLM